MPTAAGGVKDRGTTVKRVAILYGGRSGEHEVSLNSGASVFRNLDREQFEPLLIGITGDGRWYLQPPEVAEAAVEPETALRVAVDPGMEVAVLPSRGVSVSGERLGVDVAFPVLHGSFGEDGTVQGLLELASIPYVGAGVLGSALGMDKQRVKEIWEYHRLPVLPFVGFSRREFESRGPEALVAPILEKWEYPLFVKPSRAGSSVGISRVTEPGKLRAAIEEAFSWDSRVIVEPGVDAREIETAVLGGEEPRVFEPGEVIVRSEFYSYEAKYVDPEGASLEIPARLEEGVRRRIMEVAARAFSVADCHGFARVDLFLHRRSGEIYLNEINTIPGFTRISMFPKMVEYGGLSYRQLLTTLIALAEERHTARGTLRYQWL